MTSIAPSCILLPFDTRKQGALILREFKTQDRVNPELHSPRLGLESTDKIRASSQKQEASGHIHTVNFSKNIASTSWQTMHTNSVEAFIRLIHACIWHLKTKTSLRETCVIQLRHHKLSTNSFHINGKRLSHRQKDPNLQTRGIQKQRQKGCDSTLHLWNLMSQQSGTSKFQKSRGAFCIPMSNPLSVKKSAQT